MKNLQQLQPVYLNALLDEPCGISLQYPSTTIRVFGLSIIDAVDKGASLWNPATRVGSPTYVAHWSAPENIFGKNTAVGDAVSTDSDYNYKTSFETWRGTQ